MKSSVNTDFKNIYYIQLMFTSTSSIPNDEYSGCYVAVPIAFQAKLLSLLEIEEYSPGKPIIIKKGSAMEVTDVKKAKYIYMPRN